MNLGPYPPTWQCGMCQGMRCDLDKKHVFKGIIICEWCKQELDEGKERMKRMRKEARMMASILG